MCMQSHGRTCATRTHDSQGRSCLLEVQLLAEELYLDNGDGKLSFRDLSDTESKATSSWSYIEQATLHIFFLRKQTIRRDGDASAVAPSDICRDIVAFLSMT